MSNRCLCFSQLSSYVTGRGDAHTRLKALKTGALNFELETLNRAATVGLDLCKRI